MATLGDAIEAMAELVSDTKKKHRLSETTVLRIIDMNLALMDRQNQLNQQQPNFPVDENGFPLDMEDSIPLPEGDEALAAALHIVPNTNAESEDAAEATTPEVEE